MISMRIFGTPVKAKRTVLLDLVALWGGVTWLGLSRHRERRLGQGVLIGWVSAALLLAVDLGHALAHIFSARYAGAPMDEILISPGMPRTLYRDNEVSPDAHRLRALGGPIFNAFGLLLSVAIYRVASSKPITRELAAWSAVGNGLQLIASLSPLPVVDGGVLLKWTLVARGRKETEADDLVRRIDRMMGIAAGIVGAGFIALQMWIAGVISMGLGLLVIAIAAGKIR